MKTPSLYLDTSAIGGYFDDEWKDATRELCRQMEAGHWCFLTSVVAVDESALAPERVRELFTSSFTADSILEVTAEMDDLTAAYVANGVVPPKYADDARHVAACTVMRIDYLVSWNFKHLVNVQREAGFNGVNLLKGYPSIRIVNPLELIYGTEDQSV